MDSDICYSIILADAHHIAGLPAIEIAAAALFPPDALPPGAADDTTPFEDFDEARGGGRLWVAVDNADRPVGFALVELVDGHAHLQELDVHPEHGRQGLGRRLVEAVVDWARRKGMLPITLTTFRHLPWNGPFYERHGFRELPRKDWTPALREIVDDERADGLDVSKRVLMIFGSGQSG